MPLRRRDFIGLVAAAAAGTAMGIPAGGALHRVLSSADQPVDPPSGTEDFVNSVCTACPGACGILVRRVGGRVVSIAGNPLHPVSGGRLCAKGHATIQALNHPDRVLTPLRRTGPRGLLSSFRPESWDRALGSIAGRLGSLREQRRPEAFVFVHNAGGAGIRLASRFAQAFGSPNLIRLDRGADADALALSLTQGILATPAYDLRASAYLLSLGCDFLDAPPSPVFTARAYGQFRQTRTAHRGKFVYVDSRLSMTGSSADEWIAIRPGTHGVFALGVAAAMVAEGLYDREFVAEHCAGFDDALRPFLEERYGLERVATEAGVSVNAILRVAREFAGARGLALGPQKGPSLPGSLFDHLAAHVLNALSGNIDQPGGVLVPDLESGATAAPSASVVSAEVRKPRLDGRGPGANGDAEQLADALVTGNPYPAEMLFVASADPLFTTTGDRFREALEHVPVVVSFATIPNDTALHSDWILPEPHFLEQTDLHTSAAGVPFASAGLALPAATRNEDVRPLGRVMLEIAQRTGVALEWTDMDAFIRAEIDQLFAAKRGAIMGTAFDEAWVRMMEGAGWWVPGYTTADELWERSREAGGWWDPFYDHGDWQRVLRTASGRFEFPTGVLRQIADSDSRVAAPLVLQLFEPLPVAGGSGAELPFLLSLLDQHGGWNTWGEIHPATAREHGIVEGAELRVSSPQASIAVIARITERVVPGAIAIPVGLGREAGGRWTKGVGSNPLRLIGGSREAVSSLLNIDRTPVVVTTMANRSRA